jgi:hypothetical protein
LEEKSSLPVFLCLLRVPLYTFAFASECLAHGAVDVPGPREEVIRAREAATTMKDARATLVWATEAFDLEATAVRESAMALVKEVEDRATLAEREAQERVSRIEV